MCVYMCAFTNHCIAQKPIFPFPTQVHPVVRDYFPGGWHHYDHEGRPVFLLRLGQMDVKGIVRSIGEEGLTKLTLHICEEGLRLTEESSHRLNKPISTWTMLLDLGERFNRLWLGFASWCVFIIHKHEVQLHKFCLSAEKQNLWSWMWNMKGILAELLTEQWSWGTCLSDIMTALLTNHAYEYWRLGFADKEYPESEPTDCLLVLKHYLQILTQFMF